MEDKRLIDTTLYQLSDLIKETIAEALSGLKIEDPPKDKLMNSDEVVAYLGVAKSTLSNWKRQKRIPFKKMGKRIFFLKSEIDKMLNE